MYLNKIIIFSVFLSLTYLLTIPFQYLKIRCIIKGLSIFMLSVFSFGKFQGIHLLLCLGLLFSSFGDIFISLNSKKYFIHSLLLFLLSHLLYFTLFISSFSLDMILSYKNLLIIITLCIYFIFIYYKLHDKFKDLKIFVIFYFIALFFMTIAAITSFFSSYMLIIGVLLFVISDSFIAIELFYKPFKHINYLTWTTYYLAQLFIVFGIIGVH